MNIEFLFQQFERCLLFLFMDSTIEFITIKLTTILGNIFDIFQPHKGKSKMMQVMCILAGNRDIT